MTRSPGFTPSRMSQRSSTACAEADRHEARAVVVAHHKHLAAAGIVAANGLLRHRKRVGVDALHDLHAHVHAGQQRHIRIRKLAAQRHLAGSRIDRGVGEQQLALVRIELAVVENRAAPARSCHFCSAPVSNSRRSSLSSAADCVKSA